jgi:hypothetical protein
MKILSIIFSSCLILTNTFAQNYEAKYLITFSGGIPINGEVEGDSIKMGIPAIIKGEISLVCNNKYISLTSSILSSETLPNINIEFNVSEDKCFIDLERSIVLMGSKIKKIQIQKLKKKRKNTNKKCTDYSVAGFEHYTITTCKDMPWFITPGFLVKSKSGTSAINTSTMKLELVSYNITDKIITVPEELKGVDASTVKEIFRYFH